MSKHIVVNYNMPKEELMLPMSISDNIDINLASFTEEIIVGVENFPTFLKSVLEANLALIRADINLNILSQRLIVDTDPLLISDLDTMTLRELNIGQNKTFYSI